MARLNASLDREVALKNARVASTAQSAAQTVQAPTQSGGPDTAANVPAEASSPVAIPDFSDEELASLDRIATPAAPQPTGSSLFNATPAKEPARSATIRLQSEESVVPSPANAVAMPKGEIVTLPVGIKVDAEDLVPAKFISSHEYFGMKSDIKAMRRSLRVSDDQLKDGVLRHEQLDLQYRRVALDMNAIQDQLMKIDRALFEE